MMRPNFETLSSTVVNAECKVWSLEKQHSVRNHPYDQKKEKKEKNGEKPLNSSPCGRVLGSGHRLDRLCAFPQMRAGKKKTVFLHICQKAVNFLSTANPLCRTSCMPRIKLPRHAPHCVHCTHMKNRIHTEAATTPPPPPPPPGEG